MFDREEDRFDVDAHQLVPLLFRIFVQGYNVDNPGAIHYDLQPTKVRNRFLDRLAHLILTRNVAFVKDCLAAVSDDTIDNFLTKFGLYIYDGNLCPFLREELGGGFTHARSTTADPSNLSFQSFRVHKISHVCESSIVLRQFTSDYPRPT